MYSCMFLQLYCMFLDSQLFVNQFESVTLQNWLLKLKEIFKKTLSATSYKDDKTPLSAVHSRGSHRRIRHQFSHQRGPIEAWRNTVRPYSARSRWNVFHLSSKLFFFDHHSEKLL